MNAITTQPTILSQDVIARVIEEFVGRIAAYGPCDSLDHHWHELPPDHPEAGLVYQKLQQAMPMLLSIYSREVDYSAYLSLFWQACFSADLLSSDFPHYYWPTASALSIDHIMELVYCLRVHACEMCFTIAYDNQSEKQAYEQQINEKVRGALQICTRTLVVSVELAIQPQYRQIVDIKAYCRYVDEFNRRYTARVGIFEEALYAIWNIMQAPSQGLGKGYHTRFTVFYAGDEYYNDAALASDFCKLWQDISQGYGCCYHSHHVMDKSRLSSMGMLGIGMVRCDDPKACRNVLNMLNGVHNPDKDNQYLRMKLKGKLTFGMGKE